MKVLYIESPAVCPYNMDDWCSHPDRDAAVCMLWHPDFPTDCPLEEKEQISEE